MLSSNYHLSLYTKPITVLNKEIKNERKKIMSHHSQHHFIILNMFGIVDSVEFILSEFIMS